MKFFSKVLIHSPVAWPDYSVTSQLPIIKNNLPRQEKGETGWVTRMHIDFQVSGGRKEGYRAYSEKAVTPGVWRVRVRTKEGDVLGTYTFIVATGTPESLQEVRR